MTLSNFSSGFLKRLRGNAYRDPARDWLILLICATIALAGVVVWNAWVFDTVANGGTIGATATGTPSVFNSSSLETVHSIFTSRAAEESKYMAGTYHFEDPSQ